MGGGEPVCLVLFFPFSPPPFLLLVLCTPSLTDLLCPGFSSRAAPPPPLFLFFFSFCSFLWRLCVGSFLREPIAG